MMKHTTLTFLGICFYLVFFVTAAQAASPTYYYVQAKHSGKCVHQQGGIKDNGGRVTQWQCIDQGNVKLERVNLGGGYFGLRFPHSNKCLTVQDGGLVNGTNIIQADCLDIVPPEQTWLEIKSASNPDDPYVQIQSSLGPCLHQDGASFSNGGNISLWECIDQPNVRWQFITAPTELSSCPVATYSSGKLHIPAVDVADASFVGVTSYKADMVLINALPLRFEVTTATRNP